MRDRHPSFSPLPLLLSTVYRDLVLAFCDTSLCAFHRDLVLTFLHPYPSSYKFKKYGEITDEDCFSYAATQRGILVGRRPRVHSEHD